jgi:hypothetical protein
MHLTCCKAYKHVKEPIINSKGIYVNCNPLNIVIGPHLMVGVNQYFDINPTFELIKPKPHPKSYI